MRYTIVKADTVDNLSDKINHLLSDYSHDVTPLGGPFPLREGWGQACMIIKNASYQYKEGGICLTSVM